MASSVPLIIYPIKSSCTKCGITLQWIEEQLYVPSPDCSWLISGLSLQSVPLAPRKSRGRHAIQLWPQNGTSAGPWSHTSAYTVSFTTMAGSERVSVG